MSFTASTFLAKWNFHWHELGHTCHRTPDTQLQSQEVWCCDLCISFWRQHSIKQACSLGEITLNPTGNSQGNYNFMLLATSAHISHHQWTALPMTNMAIERVHGLGHQDVKPLIQEHGFAVEWCPHPHRWLWIWPKLCPPQNAPVDVPSMTTLTLWMLKNLMTLLLMTQPTFLHEPVVDSPTLAQGSKPLDFWGWETSSIHGTRWIVWETSSSCGTRWSVESAWRTLSTRNSLITMTCITCMRNPLMMNMRNLPTMAMIRATNIHTPKMKRHWCSYAWQPNLCKRGSYTWWTYKLRSATQHWETKYSLMVQLEAMEHGLD